MKAYVLRSFGSADNLELRDVPDPVPGADQVLVRVRATSVNPYDWHFMRGEPRVARIMPGGVGLRRPAITILGGDVAGEVEAVGAQVTQFRPGDRVYAVAGGGGFGELVTVPEAALAPMPANATYEQAAAVPIAAVTALLGLTTVGRLQPGMTVLVNGASGGVGTFAVQIARALGATVVGVCSTRNVELVRSLGAAEVIDYTKDSYPGTVRRYDLVLDNAGSRPVSAFLRAMKPRGSFVVVGGQAGRWVRPAERMVAAMVRGVFASQRTGVVGSVSGATRKQLLLEMNRLIEDGSVTPVIDRGYPFAELPAAVAYQEEGHSPGKVVVSY